MTSGASKAFAIRKAIAMDLEAIKRIADQHRHELGFVLAPALVRSIERNELLIAENCEGIIGFVEFHHRRDNQTTLYHIAVQSDHRRQGIGRQLMAELICDAEERKKEFIQLKCPVDLEANEFYKNLGLCRVDVQPNKQRELVVWRLLTRALGSSVPDDCGKDPMHFQ